MGKKCREDEKDEKEVKGMKYGGIESLEIYWKAKELKHLTINHYYCTTKARVAKKIRDLISPSCKRRILRNKDGFRLKSIVARQKLKFLDGSLNWQWSMKFNLITRKKLTYP